MQGTTRNRFFYGTETQAFHISNHDPLKRSHHIGDLGSIGFSVGGTCIVPYAMDCVWVRRKVG